MERRRRGGKVKRREVRGEGREKREGGEERGEGEWGEMGRKEKERTWHIREHENAFIKIGVEKVFPQLLQDG
jgi:hypothetical protein